VWVRRDRSGRRPVAAGPVDNRVEHVAVAAMAREMCG
jgi:hypothetical protein